MNEKKFGKLVETTVNNIISSPSNASEALKEFFRQCPRQQLREGTIKIFQKCYKKLKNNSSEVLYKILNEFQFLFTNNMEVEEVSQQKISDTLWRNAMKTCVYLDPSKIVLSIDILFRISKPESNERKESIRLYIQKSIDDENSHQIGITWKNMLSDLENCKINIENFINIEHELKNEIPTYTTNISNNNIHRFYDETKYVKDYEIGRIKSSLCSFPILCYSQVLLNQDKNAKCFDLHWTISDQKYHEMLVKSERNFQPEYTNYYEGEQTLCTCRFSNLCRSRTLVDPNPDEPILYNNNNDINLFGNDDDFDKFKKFFLHAITSHKQINSSCSAMLNNIFHINKPKTEQQRTFINEYVQKLIRNKQTFAKGIEMIHYFELYDLRDELYEEIIYNSYFFKRRDAVNTLIAYGPYKERRIEIFDNLLARTKLNLLETEHEKRFVKFIGIKALPHLIWNLACDDDITWRKKGLNQMKILWIQNAARAMFTEKMKDKFKSMAANDLSEFELYAAETLNKLEYIQFHSKLDFIEDVVSENIEYAYCWAKYFNLSDYCMPEFLKDCDHLNPIAEEFVKSLTARLQTPFGADGICNFWGINYNFKLIDTPEVLKNFENKFLVESQIIGIDIESGAFNEAVLLQLSTEAEIFLVDILILFPKLTQEEWLKFFDKLFHPKIIRYGFAFENDFRFLCIRFPYLQQMLLEKERKVLCMQKLGDVIISEKIPNIFSSIKLRTSLAKLTKDLLGIEMDKEFQESDWCRRPLNRFQQKYAGLDALILILNMKEIEKRLKKVLNDSAAVIEIINKGYMSYEGSTISFLR